MTEQPHLDRDMITYIKEVVDPLMVASSLGINLDKSNRASCPIHGGDNATAFSIDERSGRWACFSHGCHSGNSDMVGLVMLVRRCNFMEAIKFLASVAGINISQPQPDEIKNALVRKDTVDFIRRNETQRIDLNETQRLEQEVAYAISRRTNYFSSMGYTEATLDYFEVGHGMDRYGIPRELFPLRNKDGHIVAIDGRRTDGGGEPRYYVQPEGFNKGNILYHYHLAKDYAQAFGGILFIVEGYKACWSMIQAGIFNTVAAMGAGLSKQQPRIILENINIQLVVLVLDGDTAGRNGTARAKRELGHLCNIVSVDMPDGEDPSTLNPDNLRQLLNPYIV